MKTRKVGVKYPEEGIPPSVEGMEVLPLVVEVGVGEPEAIFVVGVGEGVATLLVGVGEGVAVPEGVAVIAGKLLSPEAKTMKVRVIFCHKPLLSL